VHSTIYVNRDLEKAMKAFISYAHRDRAMLERLHTHLAMLRREGGIADWYDREIIAGHVIDREIPSQLESSRLFLALVSPDFLSSQYCYEKEMQTAIARHESGEMVVVPIILEPCDWRASPLNQFKALPRDGKAISDWTNHNAALLDVVTELRRLVESMVPRQPLVAPAEGAALPERSDSVPTKYRVKQSFDQIDRNDFRTAAYEALRDYFEKSARESDGIEGLRGRYQTMGPLSFTCTVVNRLIKSGRGGEAHITVHAIPRSGLGDIYYSFTAHAADNTSSGSFRVDADEYHLFLRPDSFRGGARDSKCTPQEAAQRLWQNFVEQAGITHD
jgi:hypothetical protein